MAVSTPRSSVNFIRAIEAVGIPATFELCEQIVAPGGVIANIGVHGVKVDLHLEKLWDRNISITTRLVDTVSTPMLLKVLKAKKIDPKLLITHRFKLADILKAYETFGNAARTKALKAQGGEPTDRGPGRKRTRGLCDEGRFAPFGSAPESRLSRHATHGLPAVRHRNRSGVCSGLVPDVGNVRFGVAAQCPFSAHFPTAGFDPLRTFTRDRNMANITQVTPFMLVPDLARALDFMVDVLGFAVDFRMGDYAYVSRESAGLRMMESGPGNPFQPGTRRFAYYFDCRDVDALYADLKPKLGGLPRDDVQTMPPWLPQKALRSAAEL
eukprot:gene1636-2203_t